jgi:hypothetical protein
MTPRHRIALLAIGLFECAFLVAFPDMFLRSRTLRRLGRERLSQTAHGHPRLPWDERLVSGLHS